MLELREITKRFPGVIANDRVTLQVAPGEVHALLGENGAGKTTLMTVLYGLQQPDAGEIRLHGERVRIRSPRDALRLGIGMVPQHFLLIRRHTVAENAALGLPGTPFLRPTRRVESRLVELATRYGLGVDPRARAADLSPSEQQRVEILKVLLRGARILILDEPTSVLTPQEVRGLFGVLDRMRRDGHAVIFISHKLDEVMAIADRVTVLRRGRVVASLPVDEIDRRTLARLMVGREVELRPARRPRPPGDVLLRVERLRARNARGVEALRGVSLTVRQGEILGIAGVAGNGQRELVEVLTGLRRATAGRVLLGGRDVTNQPPRALHDAGVAHIPEDRLRDGIVPTMSVAENLVLRRYRQPPFSRGPCIDLRAITAFARQVIAEYEIATPGPEVPARVLSGGNIQKLILGRELAGRPTLVVAAHPTAGLDVSATEQVHARLLQRRQEGAAVLLVSEDLDEVMALSDRIAVFFGGEIAGELAAEDVDPERLGLLMLGQRA
ncbi:MAG: ABC transporter ATP-binding protein [Armatimonadota bacterium]|nr:ABC transporter ATP-binding protein [Armatimonadota bacterium]MDR7532849.1 ABC transporter ATP-binding protein [Armatimonadota bacterium]MDR7535147.1 ABC transporter ATP-binding protein [Armatimonadota bacterium]